MFATNRKLNLFTQHSRLWQGNKFVYPVISRRSKGLSIGINLNPDKTCNFDCVYCCVDRTVPPAVTKVDLNTLRYELNHLLDLTNSGEIFKHPPFDQTPPDLQRLNDIAFSGDGEPTAFPKFEEACHSVAELLAKHRRPDVKIVTITNATLLHRPPILRALEYLDQHNSEIWAKLDAGTPQYYRQIDRTSVPFSRILKNIALTGQKRPIVIQSLFMALQGQPPTETEILAYTARLKELLASGCQIKSVQVYTVARGTAESFVMPLPDSTLDSISQKIHSLPLPVETFYAPS